MARAQASARGWRRLELVLLVFPVGAVLLAADEIGNRAPGERAGAWAWFLVMSAIGIFAGAWSGGRSWLGEVDAATRRSGTMLATFTALIGVVAFSFIGGLPKVVAMGVASGFLLAWVVVRAYRAAGHRPARSR
jgi:hypothetical protein